MQLEVYAKNEDVLWVLSCRANKPLPLFKRECSLKGKLLMRRGYDTITSANIEDFVGMSCFEVDHREPPNSPRKS